MIIDKSEEKPSVIILNESSEPRDVPSSVNEQFQEIFSQQLEEEAESMKTPAPEKRNLRALIEESLPASSNKQTEWETQEINTELSERPSEQEQFVEVLQSPVLSQAKKQPRVFVQETQPEEPKEVKPVAVLAPSP